MNIRRAPGDPEVKKKIKKTRNMYAPRPPFGLSKKEVRTKNNHSLYSTHGMATWSRVIVLIQKGSDLDV